MSSRRTLAIRWLIVSSTALVVMAVVVFALSLVFARTHSDDPGIVLPAQHEFDPADAQALEEAELVELLMQLVLRGDARVSILPYAPSTRAAEVKGRLFATCSRDEISPRSGVVALGEERQLLLDVTNGTYGVVEYSAVLDGTPVAEGRLDGILHLQHVIDARAGQRLDVTCRSGGEEFTSAFQLEK